MGGDYFALCLALEELARVDSSVAITLEAGVSLGAMPIYRFGTEAQKREWLPALCGGRAARRVRPDRARRRLRRGRHPHHRAARRRRVGDQRLEGVHHELRHRHHLGRHDHRAHRRPRPRRPPRDLRDHGARGHARLPGVAEVLQGRLERLRHPRALLRRRAGCPRRTCVGERGRGYAQFLSILDEGRVAIAALSTGLAQGCVDESVRYAHDRRAFGRPDRLLPGASSSRSRTWRCARTPRGWPTTPRRRKMLARRAVQEGGGDREARRVQRGHGQRPRRPRRSSAATGS